ncbi:hypothetical protein CK203_116253 [Vitis vinifera]|uniref:Uncharacterized protein n=1 Tax=Vitis vinifera TaxID=29760 RepID=A0A438FCQ8_VITVI|nr:hypothetical protein CK203_116253 [Vitis vinifera]
MPKTRAALSLSSCGDIQISDPFRLEGDSTGCGDPEQSVIKTTFLLLLAIQVPTVLPFFTIIRLCSSWKLQAGGDLPYSCTFGTTVITGLKFLKDDILVPVVSFFTRAFFRSPFTIQGLKNYLDQNLGSYDSRTVVIGKAVLVPSITFHVLQSNFLLITPPFMSVLFLIEFMFLLSGAGFFKRLFFEIQNFTFAMALFFVNLDVFH